MRDSDVSSVTTLLNAYLSAFSLAPVFSEADVHHWLMPLNSVVFSYVVEKEGVVDMFVSFYSLPSMVINNEKHSHINAAYMFYYATKKGVELRSRGIDVEGGERRAFESELTTLIKDALILAKKNGFDVFNCLTLMDNNSFIEELKFGKGDGELQYYLYNYRCKDLKSDDVGLVML
ncbi:glycylpeptide N-tetradecanoyltransferase [Nowakowskiella sp. JEL0078]|nr:glycylpeptide N-tetradecanoyltransferase [Nowakowskiella sp. JEL0078]